MLPNIIWWISYGRMSFDNISVNMSKQICQTFINLKSRIIEIHHGNQSLWPYSQCWPSNHSFYNNPTLNQLILPTFLSLWHNESFTDTIYRGQITYLLVRLWYLGENQRTRKKPMQSDNMQTPHWQHSRTELHLAVMQHPD